MKTLVFDPPILGFQWVRCETLPVTIQAVAWETSVFSNASCSGLRMNKLNVKIAILSLTFMYVV